MPKDLFKRVSNFSQAIDYVGKKLSKGNLDVKKWWLLSGAVLKRWASSAFNFLSFQPQTK